MPQPHKNGIRNSRVITMSQWLASQDIPARVVDQQAETIKELCAASGRSRFFIQAFANDMVATGKWEQVWKFSGKKQVPAYRRVKK